MALNKGSNVHFLLVRALEAAGVPYDQVEKVFLTPSDSRAPPSKVDRSTLGQSGIPTSRRRSLPPAHVLADGEGLVANREIHLASRRLVDERPEAIRAIVAALDREGTWARANVDAVATMLGAELSLRFEVMRRVIGRKGYGVTLIGDEVLSEQQQVADTFFEIGLIPKPIDVREAGCPIRLLSMPRNRSSLSNLTTKIMMSKTTMELFWFFPTFGDGRYLGTPLGARSITLGYLQQIASAIDQLGFTRAHCCRPAAVARTPG